MKIKLSDYTIKTDGRYKDSGKYSGEWFLEDILIPALNQLKENEKIILNLDNCQIHPGFLDETFSKLISKYKFKDFANKFTFEMEDQNLIFDILAIVIGSEYQTFGKVHTQI